MIDINFDVDEGILLESDDAIWIKNRDISLLHLLLTNKAIYMIYKKSNGLFAKATEETIIKPLADIKIINGKPMVDQVKHSYYGASLQIQFTTGCEQFSFHSKARKNTSLWVNKLYNVLTGTDAPVKQRGSFLDELGLGELGESLNGIAASLAEVADSAVQTVSSAAKQANITDGISYPGKGNESDTILQKEEHVPPTFEQPSSSNPIKYCASCGSKVSLGAKFCAACGAPVSAPAQRSETTPPPLSMPSVSHVAEQNIPRSDQIAHDGHQEENLYGTSNPSQRRHEFAGSLLKCPSCGAVISDTTVICPECGHQITGRVAVSSVQAFNNQLMAIESTRKTSRLGMFSIYGPADAADKQKLSLIRSYPIPNTIDDITEFIMLAIANIDVSVSKKSWANSAISYETLAAEMPRAISNAWVSKMKQAYQKARIMFPNENAFTYIRQLYVEKMKELNMNPEE